MNTTKKTPISKKATNEVVIPLTDLRRVMTDLAYATIEAISRKARMRMYNEKFSIMEDAREGRKTEDFMMDAAKLMLWEIDTSYPMIGKMVIDKLNKYKDEWIIKKK